MNVSMYGTSVALYVIKRFRTNDLWHKFVFGQITLRIITSFLFISGSNLITEMTKRETYPKHQNENPSSTMRETLCEQEP